MRWQHLAQKPSRYNYPLTAASLDLHPVLITQVQWGDKHNANAAGA